MRLPARSLTAAAAVAFCAATGAVGSVAVTVTAAVSLTATALIVPGTATPDPATVTNYMSNAVDYYLAPTTQSCAATSMFSIFMASITASFSPASTVWPGRTATSTRSPGIGESR